MSDSKTPLTDLLTGYEVSLFGGESEKYVRLKDCREIEERLNLCVEALEECRKQLADVHDGTDFEVECWTLVEKAEKAIAAARRPL